MKILIFSHEFPPTLGGAGVVAAEYANCLSSAGHDVTVLTKLRTNLSVGRYKLLQVRTIRKLWFVSYRKAVDFESYDLILLNDVVAAYTAGLFFNQCLLSKSIIVLHGSEPENIFLEPSLFRKITYFKFFYKRALDGVQNIISVSSFMRDKFLDYTKLHYLFGKLVVIHNFINSENFYPRIEPLFRRNFGLPEDAFVLVSASRLVLGKGYKRKVLLFERLVKLSKRNLYWLIVGDGRDATEISELVHLKGLNDRIIFLGTKSREDLAVIYSNSNLFWLLSDFEESFGLVYLEAQACGIPVIGNNFAGVREAVLDGQTGFLVESSEQVIRLFESEQFLNIRRCKLREFSGRFDSSEFLSFINNLE